SATATVRAALLASLLGADLPRDGRSPAVVQRGRRAGHPEEGAPSLRPTDGRPPAGTRSPGGERLDPAVRYAVVEPSLPALRAGGGRGDLPVRPLGWDRHQPVSDQWHH